MDGTLRRGGVEVPRARQPLLPNGVLGMGIFIITEVMLFAGLISAYTIGATAALTSWPPPNQPRLPVGETLFNTCVLIGSGVVLYLGNKAFKRQAASAKPWVAGALALGTFFVVFQGYEWVALIRDGLTLTLTTHGSFFYLIVGIHALHAVAAIAILGYVYARLLKGRLDAVSFSTAQLFWYFVVGMWPLLYWRVYLS